MINREFASSIKALMPSADHGKRPDSPVSVWKELDRLRGYPEKTAVAIFRTTGCAWYRFSACSMCGYFNDISADVKEEDLMKQVDVVASKLDGEEAIKVFTSGSFLDPLEFPISARNYFFETLSGRIDKFLVESRTEYLTDRNLTDLKTFGNRIRIAIGLESASDEIVNGSINKGSTFAKYVEAANTAKRLGMEVRTYLLLKPPFISEKEAIDDVLKSVELVRPFTTDVSINPMNIQRNTMVEFLWKKGLYRPPRLYSVAEVLLRASKMGMEVVSYPTGGDRERGAHNDSPDPKLLRLIVDSSLEQNFEDLEKYLDSLDLSKYKLELDLESALFRQMDYSMIQKRISKSSVTI
jgi:radical SAM enzyme (TIGR01210 family)